MKEDKLNLVVGEQTEVPHDDEQFMHQEDESPGFIVTDEVAKKILEMPFNVIAMRKGDHWKLTVPETEMMSQPFGRMLQKYSGKISEQYPDGFLLAFGLIAAFSARVSIDYYNAQKAKKEQVSEQKKEGDQEHDNSYAAQFGNPA